ncbi:MAG TPA: TonB-dependent receptor [Opitutaceae bacterium]
MKSRLRFTLAGALLMAPGLVPAQTAAPGAEESPYELPMFSVSTSQDRGYRAGNSVSATRIDTPIKNLPFAVNAFTDQFISDIGARQLEDILNFAPGVTNAGREFGVGTTKVNVRGFESDPQRNGFPSAGYIDAATVARVEVVKGPASLLYGQIAPGGVVNYLSKRPMAKESYSFNLSAGSYDYLRSSVDLNQPVVGGKVIARFNGVWENGFEYVDKAESETTVLAPVITWKITPRSELTLDYQWFRRRETPQAFMRQNIRVPVSTASLYPMPGVPGRALASADYFGPYVLDDRRYNASSAYDYRDSDYENFFAEYAAKLGHDWDLRAVFTWDKAVTGSYQHGFGDVTTQVPYATLIEALHGDYSLQNVFRALDALVDPALYGATSLRRAQYTERRTYNRTWQIEAAGHYQFGSTDWKPLFGATLQDGVSDIIQRTLPTAQWPAAWNLFDRSTWTDTFFPISSMPTNTRTSAPMRNTGLYTAQMLSFFDERVIAVGGVRWSKAEATTYNQLNGTKTPDFETKKTTPQIGAGWRVLPDLMLYASYSESFTAGNRQLRTAGVFDRSAEPFLGRGYEAGAKLDLFDGRLSATIAAFWLEQDNYTFTLTSINPVTGLTGLTDIQGNTVVSNGCDLDVTWSPLDNWQVYFSASYADTYYDVIRSPEVAYLVGTQPESTARDRASLWTRYSFKGEALKGWWIGGGFSYTGKKAEISNNPWLFLPDQCLVDLTVGRDFKVAGANWSTSLAWKNLTDEDEIPSVRSRGLPSRLIVSVGTKF